MIDDRAEIVRPVPRGVRICAIVTALLTVLLLTLGGFVTSFRVGMADPVWPTEPWYLLDKDWTSLEIGFLLEHTHRLAGWLVGGAATVFAVWAWFAEPDRRLRWVGLGAIMLLLVAYGEFHRGMGKVWNSIQETGRSQQQLDPKQRDYEQRIVESQLLNHVTNWPVAQGVATGGFAVGVLLISGFAAGTGTAGGWVRGAAGVGLVFVMAQGLLGGFRVFLNALMGTNLAAIHGVFGQITFATFIAAMVLAAPRRRNDSVPNATRHSFARFATFAVGLLVLQLIWAVMVRHIGSVLAQRLHILTAFALTGVLVWLAVRILSSPIVRAKFASGAYHLMIILAVQLVLGVEAYIGKFTTSGPQAFVLPIERVVKLQDALTRTGHQLIGAGLLAATVALAVRLGRPPLPNSDDEETTNLRDLSASDHAANS